MNKEYIKYLIGITCKILAFCCFCSFSLIIERYSFDKLSSIDQFCAISVIGSLFLGPFMSIYKKHFHAKSLKLYFIRALIAIGAMVTWIEGVKHFGANESVLVNYLGPIIAVFIASALKDEKINLICILSGVICYAVIFFTLKKKIEFASYGFFMAFISTCGWACYEVICKKQSLEEHFIVQAFYACCISGVILLPWSIRSLYQLSSTDIGILSILSILRIFNVILLFLAIKFVGINWLIPVSYMKFPIIASIGFIAFGTQQPPIYWVSAILLALINIIMVVMKKAQATRALKV